jgi:hypothetical protein
MKKLGCTVLANLLLAGAAVAAPQDATIPLPVDGDGVVMHDSQINVSLSPIKASPVIYDISCQIDDHSGTNVIMRFDYTSSSGGSYYGFKLNHKELTTSQGAVMDQKSDNLVESRVSLISPENASITFTNLDHNVDVRVHDCFAVPAVGMK